MKSAYELAMERLSKSAPALKLTAGQKTALADLETQYKAKVAEREIFLTGEIAKAVAKEDYDTAQLQERQLVADRRNLQADLEAKKDQIRQHGVGA